jgi:hypothetical protein
MKRTTHFAVLLFLAGNLLAQSNISKLYLIPDSIGSTQAHIIRYTPNGLFVLQNTDQFASPNGPNFIPYLDHYDLEGNRLSREQVDPSFPQFLQMFGQDAFVPFGNLLLFSGNKTYSNFDSLQNTIIQAFDFLGNKSWKIDFYNDDSLSTSGAFIPFGDSLCLHGMIRNDYATDNDFLALVKFDTLGNILWKKNVPLPNGTSGVYFRVHGATLINSNRIIWYLDYVGFSTGGKHILLETNTEGDILKVNEELSGGYYELTKGLDSTFYSAFSTQTGYCVRRHTNTYAQQDWRNCYESPSYYSLGTIRTIDAAANLLHVGLETNPINQKAKGFITKTRHDGSLVWSKLYYFPSTSDEFTVIRSVDVLPDGRIATIGVQEIQNSFYQWLMILDENGCFNGNCNDIIELTEDIVNTQLLTNATQLTIYPNPMLNDQLLYIHTGELGTMQVFNQLGVLMTELQLSVGTNEMRTTSLTNGMYYYRFRTKDGLKVASGSFLRI